MYMSKANLIIVVNYSCRAPVRTGYISWGWGGCVGGWVNPRGKSDTAGEGRTAGEGVIPPGRGTRLGEEG